MRNPKKPKDPKDPKRSQEPHKPDPDYMRPKHKPEGREHQVHKEILARRMRGGPEPTPETYARALEQWKKLPGSVVRPPTDVTLPPPVEPSGSADQGSPTSQPDDDYKDNKEHQQ
jgi:hypothetical protein